MNTCMYCGKQLDGPVGRCPYCGMAPAPQSQSPVPYRPDVTDQTKGVLCRKRIPIILLFVLAGLCLIGGLVNGLALGTQEKDLPVKGNADTWQNGDNITADIVGADLLFEAYYTENGTRKGTEGYYYLFENKQGNRFIGRLSVSDDAVFQKQAVLTADGTFAAENAEDVVTVYGTVKKMDSEVYTLVVQKYGMDSALAPYLNYIVDLQMTPKDTQSGTSVASVIGMGALWAGLFALFGFLQLKKYKKCVRVYREFGDVKTLQQQLRQTAICKDKHVMTDGRYIMSTCNCFCVVENQQVLCLYQHVHKTNFITDRCALVAMNQYGEEVEFSYHVFHMSQIVPMLTQLVPLCPRAALGYSGESLRYVGQNQIKRSK